jgi:anti-sigma factor RsiW
MSDPRREIVEDDLQAFVDDQLALEREPLVQQYLRSHPGAAQRVAVYKVQRNQLRALFVGGASEQLPPKLHIDDILKHRARRWWTGWRAAAAIMLATGLGVTSGWLVWAPTAPRLPKLATQVLVEEAVATYAVYAPDERHPVEMFAAEGARLTRWLSGRLSRTVTPPDLSKFGYTLGWPFARDRGRQRRCDANVQQLTRDAHLSPIAADDSQPDRVGSLPDARTPAIVRLDREGHGICTGSIHAEN